eukprot:363419-Chlamydomonas_euryale.AAC.14
MSECWRASDREARLQGAHLRTGHAGCDHIRQSANKSALAHGTSLTVTQALALAMGPAWAPARLFLNVSAITKVGCAARQLTLTDAQILKEQRSQQVPPPAPALIPLESCCKRPLFKFF